MPLSEQQFIDECLMQIEKRLGWGPAEHWNQYDFEKLREKILEQTGVDLSPTTLKRIWGKLKYPHSPSVTTLNTLARFLEYEDWRSFQQARQPVSLPVEIRRPTQKRAYLWWLGSVPLFILFYFLLSSLSNRLATRYDVADFTFKANKAVGEGVPNSVVFEYDASKSQTDSVYIVQTWDIRRKTLVPKDGKKHSAIYYYPGFFRTKLIIGDQVVRKHDLQITSNGWLALSEEEPSPVYFQKDEFVIDSLVEVNQSLLEKYNLTAGNGAPKIRLFNQGDFGDLMNDNFSFSTTLKNDYDPGTNRCHMIQVLIQCKDDIIIIPLSAKACVGELSLYAAGKELTSKFNDLSNFGADLNEWTTLKVETINKHMSFYVNEIEAASFTFPNDPTGIVGVQYRFNGSCAVKDTWFENASGRRELR